MPSPQEQRPRDDKDTDDSDGSFDDLFIPTKGHPTPSSSRSRAEVPAYGQRSGTSRDHKGKAPSNALVSNPGVGVNERVEKATTLDTVGSGGLRAYLPESTDAARRATKR